MRSVDGPHARDDHSRNRYLTQALAQERAFQIGRNANEKTHEYADSDIRSAVSCSRNCDQCKRHAIGRNENALLFDRLVGGVRNAPFNGMSTDHRTLSAFTLADEFASRVYLGTRNFPKEERYGIRAQIRRAAVSVPTNIVEGCARDSDREHARYFEIAFGSAREAIYLIGLASRLELIDTHLAEELALFGGRVAAALAALRKSIPRKT